MTLLEQITEAKEMRKLYLDAQKFFAENRFAQSYSIGGQTLSRVNLSEIVKQFEYWDKVLKQLNGSGKRVFRRIIPLND